MESSRRIDGFVLLAAVAFSLSDTHYILFDNETTWEEANNICTLAKPTLKYSEYGITADLDSNLLNASGEYWVGYTLHRVIFQYIGCSMEQNLTKLSSGDFTTGQIPGFCYSACGSHIFGIKDKSCYCFETRPETVNDTCLSCSKSCLSNKEIKCGGTSPATVSLFSFTNISLDNVAGDPQHTCIAVDTKHNSFIWQDCKNKLRTRCQTKTGATLVTNDGEHSWSKSADNCFSESRYPLSSLLSKSNDLDIPKQTLWTGLFQSQSVVGTFKDTAIRHGHLKIENKAATLSFDNNKIKAAICEVETTVTTLSTTSAMVTKRIEVISNKTTIDNNSDNSTHMQESLLVKIGVPLAILVGIASIVASVVFYRKRQNKSKQKSPDLSPTIVEQYSHVKDSYDEAQNVYTEPYDKAKVKPSSPDKPVNATPCMPTDDNDEYDFAGASGVTKQTPASSDDIYNKLQVGKDDTYDRTNNARDHGNLKGNANSEKAVYGVADDTYSTSGQKGMHRSQASKETTNMYEHVNLDGGSYSQVNIDHRKCEATDNVYN